MEKVALEFSTFLSGVRKLGLGVAGTGGAISTDSLGCGISAGTDGVV